MAKRAKVEPPAVEPVNVNPEEWPAQLRSAIGQLLHQLLTEDFEAKERSVVTHNAIKCVQEYRKLTKDDGSAAGSEIQRYSEAFKPQNGSSLPSIEPPRLEADLLDDDKSDADDASERP